MRFGQWTTTLLLTLLTKTDDALQQSPTDDRLLQTKDGRRYTDIPTFYNNSAPKSARKESADSPKTPAATMANKENESGGRNGAIASESRHEEEHRAKIDDAIEFGLGAMRDLLDNKEPKWYKMGLVLDKDEPASHVAKFGAPSPRAVDLANLGFAALEASRKIAEAYPQDVSRQATRFPVEARLLLDECPLRGLPRCPLASRRYRTADGTCNNLKRPWRGSALLPMQRFLPPVYEDGIQQVRRSIFGNPLPSAREVSVRIHRDKNLELDTVNLMFMQWGQLIDHDLTSTVKARSFNGSVPRCCRRGGQGLLPPDLTHPNCLPIEVANNDWFLSPFGIRCIEFVRSAPSTRIDCDLGWREQINQVTSYLDASTVYGSDVETSDSMRTFKRGKLHYGRPQGREPLQPPDPPGGELCRSGALTSDCLQGGDGRFSEQPGLTALHTIWLRYHNRIASILSQLNNHWSDEKVFQETRRIIAALIQHITYREFLPIVLGQEVVDLFELNLERKGYYSGYDARVNPVIANSFSTAAFRFGHSLVQNSYVRFDIKHRPLFNNVSLHEELDNPENIWSFGSLDRILLGFCNQPSQRRDEFICDELTNHLFQSGSAPFGMDLAAINIQRGRDHGLPSYTSWRDPCGLSPIQSWADLQKIMHPETVQRFKILYDHFDDIDLFSGGLAEKPVRGGIVGPTFACIIAQQFLNLRKGDRFWYENGKSEASFTPAQLQQLRHVTLAQILCQTLTEVETIQPFVFLAPDGFRNARIPCDSPIVNNFDLSPWIENDFIDPKVRFERSSKTRRNRRRTTTTTRKPSVKVTKKTNYTEVPLKIKISNITTKTVPLENKQSYSRPNVYYDHIPNRPTYNQYSNRLTTVRDDVTYLFGVVSETTTEMPSPKPIEVNIKIQYYPQTTQKPKKQANKKKRPTIRPYDPNYDQPTTRRPQTQATYDQSNIIYSDDFAVSRPTYHTRPQQDSYLTRPQQQDSYLTRPQQQDPYLTRPQQQDPYFTRPQQQDSYIDRYEDLPFSTSKRPYIYRPNSNHYIYSNVYTTTKKPQTYDYHRPNYGLSDRDDSLDALYSQIYSSNTHSPSFYSDLPKPIRKYSTGHVERVPADSINDKLDFHTRSNQNVKFVKISSVKGQELVTSGDANIELHVAQREGDLQLDDAVIDEEIRLVDLEVVPDEARWTLYNASEEIMAPIDIPDVNLNVSCSTELPRPMKVPENATRT